MNSTKGILTMIWTIIIGLILLFVHGAVYGAEFEPLVVDNGDDTITMGKDTLDKLRDAFESQQALLARTHAELKMLEQKYNDMETCVRDAAANGVAVTPCFNIEPTRAIGPKEHHQWLKNTTEY